MKVSTYDRPASERGSALITVFWLIAILGMVMFGATKFVSLDSTWISGLRKSSLALRHAETGLAIASHPQVEAGDPVLRQTFTDGGSYMAEVTTEEGLIPINVVLSSGNRKMVKRLFQNWGVDERSAAAVTDALADWIDADDLTGLNGAEAGAYAAMGRSGMPFNQPFSRLDEMRLVRGMEAIEIVKPDWASFFTVYSNGQFDLNAAATDAMAAVLGISRDSARAAVIARDGLDGIRGTLDDLPFASVEVALQTLGVLEFEGTDFLTVNGQTRRIVSDGTFGDVKQRLVEVRDSNDDLKWRGKFTLKISDGEN